MREGSLFELRSDLAAAVGAFSLEIQLAGAHKFVELPLKRIFHIGIPGRCFGLIGAKGYEWN